MTQEEFVECVKNSVEEAAYQEILDLLKKPAGRSPSSKKTELSNWYNELNEDDRLQVHVAIEEGIKAAIFGFFCILDGVRVFDRSKSRLYLGSVSEVGDVSLILSGENFGELHDIYVGNE